MPTVLPEANYITDYRKRVRVYAVHEFVGCIDTTWNGCTPSIHSKPYYDFEPTETASEYYLAFGLSSDYYFNLKILYLAHAFVVDDGYFFLGIYTDPDNKKHILFKYGAPIDVPAVEKVWIIRRDGKILYGEIPRSEDDLVEIGTVDNTFFLIDSDVAPPIIAKGKFPWAVVALVLGLAGIAGATYWAVETHRTDRAEEAKKYAVDKAYEWLNNLLQEVKNNPSLADPFSAIIESWYGSNAVTWQMPTGVNPHATTQEDTNPFEQFIQWIQRNWYYIVVPLIGVVVLLFKWEVIIDFIKGILERFRRR